MPSKEHKNRIVLEGEKEYIESLRNIKKETIELRKEVEQLNAVLDKEIELLKKLG